MTIQVTNIIQYIEQINDEIAVAIQTIDFPTAIDLDKSRCANLDALRNFEGPLSDEQLERLEHILHNINSEIVDIETAMRDLNKNTGRHIRRLEGYR
jgi:hypothetical protein